MTDLRQLYLDDYAVGDRHVSHEMVVSEADIVAFARQFDPQPFHTDPVAAETSIFGGLAASGWHTAAITMRLFVDSFPHPVGGLLGAGVERLEWPRPVRPGDSLHVEVEVLSVRVSRSKPGIGIVQVRGETKNQHGQTVQPFEPKMIVPTRPASAPATPLPGNVHG